jgi:DNA repair exonuclease SbcCD ATPase subunit
MNRAFQQYLRSRSFGLASDAISALKGAGANTQDQEKDLADARNDYQQTLSSQIKDMIADGRFGAARSKIAALKDVAPPDMVDAINSEFQDQMSSYEKQADDAVNASSVGDPAAAFNQLKIFADQHPDDINLQLALGHLLTRMPPDHTRLSNQLDAFKSFNRTILDTAELSDLNALETRIQNELATYDRLAAQLDAAKGGSGGGSSIKELQREIAHDQASIAAADGVNSAVDTLTSSFLHTHVRVVNVSEKKDEIAEDNAKINQIEASQQNSQGAVAAAQRQFDAFCATVPW